MVSFARCTSCHMARRLMSTNPARLETDRKHMDVSYPRPICVTQHIGLVVFTVRWRQQQCKGGEQERCPELGWKRLCFPFPLAQSRQQKTAGVACFHDRVWRTYLPYQLYKEQKGQWRWNSPRCCQNNRTERSKINPHLWPTHLFPST